eukprot:TRINITY_DN48287_c0_g1_i1.p1 TRINITY_DN48287_c0_g1~~TRINITY_DN48287_c0_g1_i1.p1  ORF type:complete len:128 (+),score=7.71 TRINITY_DN48287_c0_g1_i1:163-546(+)
MKCTTTPRFSPSLERYILRSPWSICPTQFEKLVSTWNAMLYQRWARILFNHAEVSRTIAKTYSVPARIKLIITPQVVACRVAVVPQNVYLAFVQNRASLQDQSQPCARRLSHAVSPPRLRGHWKLQG